MDAEQRTGPLYLQLASHYRRAIAAGSLAPAARMPSVRALMALHRVSLATALQACRHLESEGLLEARPRQGYFVRATALQRRLPPAAEPLPAPPDPARYVGVQQRISALLARALAARVQVNLAGASAQAALYPLRALALQGQRLLRRHPELLVEPPPPDGLSALREALARLALDAQVALRADEVLVTHGCTEALTIALRAVARPGDAVAVESPTYYGLLQILESLGLRALEIPTSPHTGLSLDALQTAARQEPALRAVVVMPNLQNPLGSVMPDAHKKALLAWCDQQDLALIEDDTYGALADDPQRAIKSWDRDGRVILCSSLHKTLAPGMRLGWMTAGRWHARARMLKYTQSRPNEALGQAVVAAFLSGGQMDRHLRGLRRRLTVQRGQMAEALADHLPAGTRLSLPPGGMALWLALPPGLSSEWLFGAALERGIRLAPGVMFSNATRFDGFVRINCGHPMDAAQHEAIRTLGRLCEQALQRPTGAVRDVDLSPAWALSAPGEPA